MSQQEQTAAIAVLDTETNYLDEVISIGVVVADAASYQPLDRAYYIITPEYLRPAMFSGSLKHRRAAIDGILPRGTVLDACRKLMDRHGVHDVFAYNASFDKRHLPEYSSMQWYDIMKVAAYRQYNPKLPADREYCKTGRLRYGRSAEDLYRLLSGGRYAEVHNALTDAEDELEIMRMIGVDISAYDVARI